MTVVYLLAVSSQPRYWRRINALTSEGLEARILTFNRPYVPASREHAARAEVVASITQGKYLRRLAAFARAFIPVYRRSRDADFLYCFGSDLAALGIAVKLFRRRLRLVLEVGDVRPVMINNDVKGTLLRALERLVLRQVFLIVVTSPAYRDRYLVDRQGVTASKILAVENKVDVRMRRLAEPVRGGEVTPGSVLSIGYYGIIRCQKSWSLLERIAKAFPDRVHVHVWGHLMLKHRHVDPQGLPPTMSYHGEFRNPEHLPEMFRRFGLAWVAHAHGTTNTRWARANRFYEACCFGTPMIGQQGTLDGREIDRLGVGLCIDVNYPEEALERIASITDGEVSSWKARVLALDEAVYQYTGEHSELARRMRQSRIGGRVISG